MLTFGWESMEPHFNAERVLVSQTKTPGTTSLTKSNYREYEPNLNSYNFESLKRDDLWISLNLMQSWCYRKIYSRNPVPPHNPIQPSFNLKEFVRDFDGGADSS
jgi:hypothetical protein